MPGITFSPEDIASTNKLTAGWYTLLIKSIVPGPGKKDPTSTTWTCEFAVVDGAPEFNNTPVRTWFSDKMPKNIINFMSCFVAKIEPGKEYPIESTVGKKVQAYCNWNMEMKSNEILDFKK